MYKLLQKLKGSALFCLLSCIILVISVLSMIPRETASGIQAPEVTVRSLIDGSFMAGYEAYVNDQLVLQDTWIGLKSVSESALLKVESNGVVYGKNGYMFQKFSQFDPDILLANLDAIDAFAYHAQTAVSVIVVPSAYYPLADFVPQGVPMVDQNYYINEINRYLSNTATPINVKDTLVVNAGKYIYYRTDHHWTAYGAWLAYDQFTSARDLRSFDYKSQQPVQALNFLGSSYAKTRTLHGEPDVLEYFDFPGSVTIENTTHGSLYDYEQFQQDDKYAGLLYGNHGIRVVEGEQSSKKLGTILVICDSYANSFVPYLTHNYNKIIMIDPRYYNGSYEQLRTTRYDDILMLLGFESYCNEPGLAKLAGE